MKVFLTGASGYVGGSLLHALRSKGHDVLALSRRSCQQPWHTWQLNDDPALLPWHGCEALVHAAHDFSARGEGENQRRNVQPSVALLRAAHEAGVPKLIHISSFSAFDGTRSIYGRVKLAIEKECLALGGTVIRPGLVWGDQSGGVMGALERIVTSLPIVPCLAGPCGLPQYLIHEADLSRAVNDALETASATAGQLLEAAHPDPIPLKQILILVARRHRLRRIFPPVPWQLAMAALKTAEFLGLDPPFRSDSLTGLVHSVPEIQSDPALLRASFRSFQ